jgi:hypothetical protein
MMDFPDHNLARFQQVMDETRPYNEFTAGSDHVLCCGTVTPLIKHGNNAPMPVEKEAVEAA